MKKIQLYVLAALFLAGCAKEPVTDPVDEHYGDEVPVRVTFGMDIQSDTETLPLTKAYPMGIDYGYDTYKVALFNTYQVIVMKWIDDGLYLDRILSYGINGTPASWDMIKYYREEETAGSFEMVLRPGEYVIGVLLNGRSFNMNENLIPGKKLWERGADAKKAEHLGVYRYETTYDMGYSDMRGVGSEMYYGVAELSVAKTTDLSTGPQPATLSVDLNNMTGKVRFIGKRTDNTKGLNFWIGELNAWCTYELRATDESKPLPEGINVLGKAYYGKDGKGLERVRLGLVINTEKWIASPYDGEDYVMSTYGMNLIGMFYFGDPDIPEGIPGQIGDIEASYHQNLVDYNWSDTPGGYGTPKYVDKIFKNKAINTLVFAEVDQVWEMGNKSYGLWELAKDESGNLIDGDLLFGPYLENNVKQ